jgi:hypothetical protein
MTHDSQMSDSKIRERAWTAVRSAIGKVRAGQPQDEVCVFCGGTLVVEGMPPGGPFSIWLISCPCGKSNGEMKGL